MNALDFCVHFIAGAIGVIDRIAENINDGGGTSYVKPKPSVIQHKPDNESTTEGPESEKKYEAQIKHLRRMSLQKDDEILRLQNEIDSQADLLSGSFVYSDDDNDDDVRKAEDLFRSLTTISKFMQTERSAEFASIQQTDTPDWKSFSADEMETLQGLLRQISCSRRTIECLEGVNHPGIQEDSESQLARKNTWDLGLEDYGTVGTENGIMQDQRTSSIRI